jgi:predicted metal-binding membrane protein
VFGLAVYVVYRPHAVSVAGALTIAAGIYELTPFKRECRRRCRHSVGSGFRFGCYCVGSCLGPMVVLIAVGIMSIAWMAVVAALVAADLLLPSGWPVDRLVGLGLAALGLLILITPTSVPGLVVPM